MRVCRNSHKLKICLLYTSHIWKKSLSLYVEVCNGGLNQYHSVRHYADKLCITPNYLNEIINSAMGMSAKQYIQNLSLIHISKAGRAFLKKALWLTGVIIPVFSSIDQLSVNLLPCTVVWHLQPMLLKQMLLK